MASLHSNWFVRFQDKCALDCVANGMEIRMPAAGVGVDGAGVGVVSLRPPPQAQHIFLDLKGERYSM